mgnify:CR=1 FL=1
MRVLNKRYWPYQIRMDSNLRERWIEVRDLERFCYDNFKTNEWRNEGYYFAFKQDTDYTFFMLRWN